MTVRHYADQSTMYRVERKSDGEKGHLIDTSALFANVPNWSLSEGGSDA